METGNSYQSPRYLKHAAIDRQEWDTCIRSSAGGEVYAQTAYLDAMCGEQWDALVYGDYEAVMPLPFRKKWGICYVYPPAFTQQLGIISRHDLKPAIENKFFESIPSAFRYIEMNLHHQNLVPSIGKITERKNYLLDISSSYDELQAAFSRSCKRNIRKSEDMGIQITEDLNPASVIDLHRERFKDEIGSNQEDYIKFEKLCDRLQNEKMAYIIGAKNSSHQLIAGSIFFHFRNKIYFVLNGNNAESLENGATHLLMDHTIRAFAGRHMIIDFEGSDTASFARLYEQYGAKPEIYSQIRINRLPWPLSLFKR